ncbi:MAG: TlpA disulfide reductase family protein [Balneolaceae bacterium]|nr:TlpA disulfide reductase family protein [Balneolaceae bacterium]
MSESDTTKTKSWKRELIEWGILIGVAGVLWLTGLHTEVIGKIQQAILWTGVLQPDTEITAEQPIEADYNIPLVTLEGEQTTLEPFKNRVVFINFWATWCAPCIAEMPNIDALYERYRDNREITFAMVSVDRELGKSREFIENKEFSFPVYHLSGPRPAVYAGQVIPTTYVINKSGHIVARSEGMANYNTRSFRAFLDTLIAE